MQLSDVIQNIESPVVEPVATTPAELTAEKIQAVYPYLQWLGTSAIPPEFTQYAGKGYGDIVRECGVTLEQVQQLHAEYLAAIAPEPLAPESV